MSLEVNEKVCNRCSKEVNENTDEIISCAEFYCSNKDCQKKEWKSLKKNEISDIKIDEISYNVIARLQEVMLVAKVKQGGMLFNPNMINPQTFDAHLNTDLEVNMPSHLHPAHLSFISSLSNEYFASFLVLQDSPTVKITVYQFKLDQICLHWQGDFPLSADDKYVAVIDADG